MAKKSGLYPGKGLSKDRTTIHFKHHKLDGHHSKNMARRGKR